MIMLIAIPLGIIFGTIQVSNEKKTDFRSLFRYYTIGLLMAAWGTFIMFYIVPRIIW